LNSFEVKNMYNSCFAHGNLFSNNAGQPYIDLYGARNVSVFILILLGTFELLTKHVELFIKKSFSLNSN
jgi:hypothetical protein